MVDPNWNLLKAKSPAICSYPVQPVQVPLKRTARAILPTIIILTIRLQDWPTDLVARTATIVDEAPRPHGDNKRKRHLNRAN